jgi:hypothetical protein
LLALTNGTAIRHAASCGHPDCRTGKRPCTHPPAGPGLGPPPPDEAASAAVRKPVGTLEYLRNWPQPPPDPNEEPAPF